MLVKINLSNGISCVSTNSTIQSLESLCINYLSKFSQNHHLSDIHGRSISGHRHTKMGSSVCYRGNCEC